MPANSSSRQYLQKAMIQVPFSHWRWVDIWQATWRSHRGQGGFVRQHWLTSRTPAYIYMHVHTFQLFHLTWGRMALLCSQNLNLKTEFSTSAITWSTDRDFASSGIVAAPNQGLVELIDCAVHMCILICINSMWSFSTFWELETVFFL